MFVSAVVMVAVLLLGGPVADAFELPLWWLWVLAIGEDMVASCLCAAVLARGVLRGSNAARWGLTASSTATAVVCAMTIYLVWTGVVALAALVVMALLSLPSTGQWTRCAGS